MQKQLAVEYSSHWLETAAVAAFLVVEITDCVHSPDDSFQRVPRGMVLNALSVVTVCQNSITKLDKCVKLHTMHFTCSS